MSTATWIAAVFLPIFCAVITIKNKKDKSEENSDK